MFERLLPDLGKLMHRSRQISTTPERVPAVVESTTLRGGFRFPPRGRYEKDATVYQKHKLEKLGGRDYEMMEVLGKDQIEYLIHHLEMEAWERQDEGHWEEGRNFVSNAAMTFCLIIAVVVLALIAWDRSHPGSRFMSREDTPADSTAAPAASGVASSQNPASATRALAEFRREVGASQARAVRRHPSLGVSGSHFNAAFVARYQQLARQRSPRLDSSNWPERLADECASQLPASYQ